ncbi:VCBS repeat-containing protein [Sulfitobacter sp. F26169L]|uniref:FG-GAP repeat domain-containing protein n=1 Tax=Sulfitobacter sp. F26169L TaxID=2996015 RepID=UPI002260FA14|nr:VCBS repeat-containing protein [Sulfitobacter sp. F26169L]MCX7564909.1 VCBS repeat-containing protein [Sulfitobacter sp. F26169L]
MPMGARRLRLRKGQRPIRRALLTLCAGLALLAPAAAQAETITAARYAEPTSRYAHGIFGDAEEWGALEIDVEGSPETALKTGPVVRRTIRLFRLPITSVFEDIAPRLADVDGDGHPEVIVVETDVNRGASLAIYSASGKMAATPYIGQRNRWLAPVTVADLDGDGLVEIAYIDRPHLAKTLRIWRFESGTLSPVANAKGLTNHRIGDRDIAGGLRTCGATPEMIVANADWTRLIAVTFDGTTLHKRDIGPHKGRSSFRDALSCK